MTSPLAKLMVPMSVQWSPANIGAVSLMWVVMMAVMMLPTSMPMILTFNDLNRLNGARARTLPFVAAYVGVWSAFGLFGVGLQWGLQVFDLTSHMIASTSAWFTSALLLIAGLFQFSRIKTACLRRCRTPMGFLLTEWRQGSAGAWVMGLRHGGYCLGCCWALMILLFVGGAMNLLWIAALMGIVIIEKLLPWGSEVIARLLGGILIFAGGYKLILSMA